ncbi:hypothetical protein EV421DRAFT_1740487 [Armillaria borealis]|uniref:Uncharacterized protein n=1 Tax=Armillaria borealis TaxID=47425 RepID=A0AA39J4C3_9AGAR|nr:hypothetical protein EV421DRAFT_1740487 [Armillaria borealis]
MSKPCRTRGNAVTIPEELKKRTQEERHVAREAKIAATQETKKRAKAVKDAKVKASISHVASQQDKQALEDGKVQSLHPDLDEQSDLPSSLLASESATMGASPPALPEHSPSPEPGFDNGTNPGAESTDDGTDLPPATAIDTDSEPGLIDEADANDVSDGDVAIQDVDADQFDVSSGDDSDYVDKSDVDSGESEQNHYDLKGTDKGEDGKSSIGTEGQSDEGIQMEEWEIEFQEFLAKKRASLKAANTDAAGSKQAVPALSKVKVKKVKEATKASTTSKPGKKVQNRQDVRNAVQAAHTESSTSTPVIPQPKPEPQTGTRNLKRKDVELAGQEITPDTTKRSRTQEVGGLATNWREFYTNPASKKRGQLSIASSGQVIVVKKEAECGALAVATEAEGPAGRDKGAAKKVSAKSQKGAAAHEIVLKEGNVKKIEVREHGKKTVFKNHDLPFADFSADLPLWQQKFIPSILDWCGCEIPEPFSATSLPAFKTTVRLLWTKIFLHLNVILADGNIRADRPAISAVAATAVRTHRSEIGKLGHKNIEIGWSREDMRGYATIEARKEWVQRELQGARFLYANPDAEVKRGLTLWKEGYDSHALKETTARNTEYSFKDDPWGTVAQKYYAKTSLLSDDKWMEIFQEVAQYLLPGKVRKGKSSALSAAEGSQVPDSDDNIDMSD